MKTGGIGLGALEGQTQLLGEQLVVQSWEWCGAGGTVPVQGSAPLSCPWLTPQAAC